MANQGYVGIGGGTQFRKADGAGTDTDPFLSHFKEEIIRIVLGTSSDAADKDGTLMARLRWLTNNPSSGGSSAATSQQLSTITVSSVSTAYPGSGSAEISTAGWEYLSLWVQNTGAVALAGFKLEGGFATALPFKYKYIAETAANYTTEAGKQSNNQLIHVIESSGLPAIGAAGDGWVQLWVPTLDRIRISARTASDTTSLQINGLLTR